MTGPHLISALCVVGTSGMLNARTTTAAAAEMCTVQVRTIAVTCLLGCRSDLRVVSSGVAPSPPLV